MIYIGVLACICSSLVSLDKPTLNRQVIFCLAMGSVDNDANPYGLKTIVKWLDDKAAWTPHHTYLRYPGPDWETQGYSTITWRQYRDAANRIAHWLDEKLGPDSGNDTIAYMGPNDVRYGLLLPAVVKTGRKVSKSKFESVQAQFLMTRSPSCLYATDASRVRASRAS